VVAGQVSQPILSPFLFYRLSHSMMFTGIITSVSQNGWWCMTPSTPAYYAYLPYVAGVLGVVVLLLVYPRMKTFGLSSASTQILSGLPVGSGSNSISDNDSEVDAMDVALRLLNKNERLIVEKLLESGNTMLQKDLAFELDMSPVKVHRAIVSLKEKRMVTSEKHYNTNRITIDDSFLH